MNYQDKIEAELNDLQKTFFRNFIKSFPALINRIEIEKGIIFPGNFYFSVKSESQAFGKLSFDIDETEITVFSDFSHTHFPTFHYDEIKNIQMKNQLTCASAIEYINDFINGNITIEYQEQDGKLLRVQQYYKDEPEKIFSATINIQEPQINNLISKMKNIFQREKSRGSKIITKKVNWHDEVN